MKVFGALALLSFGVAYYFYTTWFISVWCFFAAVLSVVIYHGVALRQAEHGQQQPTSGPPGPLQTLEKNA